MYSVKSLEKVDIYEGATVFIIRSPIKVTKKYADYLSVLGKKITIDGNNYMVEGLEWRTPLTPVSFGQRIGLLIEDNNNAKETKA